MTDVRQLLPLIDCDVLTYRCGFAADGQMKREALEHEPGATPQRVAEMLAEVDYKAKALQNVKTVMDHVISKFNGDYRAFIYGGGNFRYELATMRPYKGNRDKMVKPKYFRDIQQYITDVWKAEVVVGQESDDAIGIYQCACPYGTTVICSNDKDMDQIPGWHFNWIKDELYEVSPEEADMMLFYQMLTGDSTDNIPGVTNIGPKKASKILDKCMSPHEAYDAVKKLYEKEFGDKHWMVMDEVANLLWIRRRDGERCPWLTP